MGNLDHYRERILDKLYPQLGKITIPYDELVRISELYYVIFKNEKDEYLLNHFSISIESNLSFVINQDYKYQELTEYKKDYLLRVKDYIEDHDHISTWNEIEGNEELIKELTIDYLEECISEQDLIIDKTVKHMIPIPDRASLNVMQFVSDEFLDEYKRSSKRKINFLNAELNQLKGFPKPIEAVERKEYKNPYPEYFNSYGYELYEKFTLDFKKEDVVLSEMSFLVDRLRKDGLMNEDKTLISIFNFMVDKFDTNFGKSFKFKSDYSTKKYLPQYKALVSLFENKD
jgi:hypothetical protein